MRPAAAYILRPIDRPKKKEPHNTPKRDRSMGASRGTAEPSPPPPPHARRYPSPLVKQELAKLGRGHKLDPESRRNALASLRAVVEEHLHTPASLQRFVQQMEESSEGRGHAAPIVADLARAHGPRLAPHLRRLLHILLHTLLQSAADPHLQSDCAAALSSLATHAIAPAQSSSSWPSSSSSSSSSSSTPPDVLLRHISLPLIALLSHKVQVLSSGAAACLCSLVASRAWLDFADPALATKLCTRASAALVASRSARTVPHLSLLRSLAASSNTPLAHSAAAAAPILRFLLHDLLVPSPSNPASSSWQLRVAALQLLETLLSSAASATDTTTLAATLRPAIQILGKCRLDKMPHVRKAAMSALKVAEAMAGRDDVKQRMAAMEELSTPANGGARPITTVHSILSSAQLNTDLSSSPPTCRRGSTSFDDHNSSTVSIEHMLKHLNPASDGSSDHFNLLPAHSKQTESGISDELSAAAAAAAADDESDYFRAYFLYDTKEKVSCRKIVHHIHDTNISSTTGAASSASNMLTPPRNPDKVAVPPLSLSSIGQESLPASASILQPPSKKKKKKTKKPKNSKLWLHHGDGGFLHTQDLQHEAYITEDDDDDNDDDHDSYLSSSSVSTRHVRVLESHEELLASCGVKLSELRDLQLKSKHPMNSSGGGGNLRNLKPSSLISGDSNPHPSQILPEIMTKIVEADERQSQTSPTTFRTRDHHVLVDCSNQADISTEKKGLFLLHNSNNLISASSHDSENHHRQQVIKTGTKLPKQEGNKKRMDRLEEGVASVDQHMETSACSRDESEDQRDIQEKRDLIERGAAKLKNHEVLKEREKQKATESCSSNGLNQDLHIIEEDSIESAVAEEENEEGTEEGTEVEREEKTSSSAGRWSVRDNPMADMNAQQKQSIDEEAEEDKDATSSAAAAEEEEILETGHSDGIITEIKNVKKKYIDDEAEDEDKDLGSRKKQKKIIRVFTGSGGSKSCVIGVAIAIAIIIIIITVFCHLAVLYSHESSNIPPT